MKKLTLRLSAAGALFCASILPSANGAAALANPPRELNELAGPASPRTQLLSRGQPGSRLTHLSSKASATEDHTSPLPWSEIGAKAGADYHGDGLSVTAAGNGARLRCAFQRLEGEATTEGLWLVSTVIPPPGAPGGTAHDRFRVVAARVGRSVDSQEFNSALQLSHTGTVQVSDKLVHFLRPGLIEDYSVSVDGVRQDFVVTERPAGAGELQVQLAVSGARVESGVNGACPVRSAEPTREAGYRNLLSHGAVLVLTNSGRRIAYSRLRARPTPPGANCPRAWKCPKNPKSEI